MLQCGDRPAAGGPRWPNCTEIKPLESPDPIWTRIRSEAEAVVRQEPSLPRSSHGALLATQFACQRRCAASQRPSRSPGDAGTRHSAGFHGCPGGRPDIADAFRADIIATYDRDPATTRFIEPVLYFKGFHAIQNASPRPLAMGPASQGFCALLAEPLVGGISDRYSSGRRIGRGIFLDHATGLVVGETAVIDDDVSILHGVTLGGTGNENGDRHPKIRKGVLIGAGAKILGNIEVGHCARIAAGSVVIKPVPHNVTVAGVPAKVIGEAGCSEPSRTMDQMLHQLGF